MTELRDARLQRALLAAPDGDALPSDATRRAVREAALRAIRPVSRPAAAPWWQRWFGNGERRMPWNAAFATVLIAGLVTVLWQGKEVPDARPEASRGDAAIPAAPAAPAPAADPAPAAAVASATGVPSAPAARVPAAKAAPAPKPPTAAPDTAKAADAAALQKRAAKDLAAASRAPEAPPPAAVLEDRTAAQAAPRAENRSAAPVAQAPAAGLAPAAAPQPMAPAPAAAPMAREASPRFQAAPADWRQWSELRISSAGRSVVVPRDARMAQLAEQLQAQAAASPSGETAQWRIEFLAQGGAAAVLELASSEARWLVRGQPPRSTTDAALLRALHEEAQRLMPR
jgi:hypothetical protein